MVATYISVIIKQSVSYLIDLTLERVLLEEYSCRVKNDYSIITLDRAMHLGSFNKNYL